MSGPCCELLIPSDCVACSASDAPLCEAQRRLRVPDRAFASMLTLDDTCAVVLAWATGCRPRERHAPSRPFHKFEASLDVAQTRHGCLQIDGHADCEEVCVIR